MNTNKSSNNSNEKVNNSEKQVTFKEIEQQKFATYNPIISDSIRLKRMYWSSKLESLGRIILIFVALSIILMNGLIAKFLVNPILEKNHFFNDSFKPAHMIYITIGFSISASLIIFIPVLIVRSASTLFNWSVFYIAFAILFFLCFQILFTILVVLKSLMISKVTSLVPIFMGITLFLTILWLISSCILIVKSDDIRKELNVE